MIRTAIRSIAAAALTCLALAAPTAAAVEQIDLFLTLDPGSRAPSGADVGGTVLPGSVSYDDALLSDLGGGAFSASGTDVTVNIPFLGRSIANGAPGFDDDLTELRVDGAGGLLFLDIFVDIGNDFFFSTREVAGVTTFSYDFSDLIFDDELDEVRQITIARGSGVIADTPPVAPVPLPAGLPLILAGLGGLTLLRRRGL